MLFEHMRSFNGRMDEWGQQQFSQFGEDVCLWAWLETLVLLDNRGFYVDVGAHHPRKGSNTYLLRKVLGWTGINIEPDPKLFSAFLEECPDCINLQLAVGDKPRTDTLTIYNHPAANTVSNVLRARQSQDPRIEVVDEIAVEVRPLNEILKSYLPADRDFRLLTIDAEGSDYEIISSLDTDQYKPNLILIEDFDFNLSSPTDSKIFTFLRAIDYAPVSHCMVTTLYRRLFA
jgi:FkbM family methyltransferase